MNHTSTKKDQPLLLFVHQDSPRLIYVLNILFTQLLEINYKIVLERPKEPHISYLTLGSRADFLATDYLFTNHIAKPHFESGTFEERIFPFYHGDKSSMLPFDPFATCFYFLSRHEEYTHKDKDEHGRFMAKNSWLWQNGWQSKPIVNWIADWLGQYLAKSFRIENTVARTFSIAPTVDIDNPFAFYGRANGLKLSIFKSIFTLKWNEAKHKLSAKKDAKNDPFNTHSLLIKHLKNKKSVVFFLMKSGGKNSISGSDAIKNVVSLYRNANLDIGIHPSYQVQDLSAEINTLKTSAKQAITKSRHHFIATDYTKDISLLAKDGVLEDFSMGYGNQNGFRAGICVPFVWFDLCTNQATNMLINPFVFMDAASIYQNEQSAEQALEQFLELKSVCKYYKGVFCYIIHNELPSLYGVHKKWQFLWEGIKAEG
jgi:hypothetical protein